MWLLDIIIPFLLLVLINIFQFFFSFLVVGGSCQLGLRPVTITCRTFPILVLHLLLLFFFFSIYFVSFCGASIEKQKQIQPLQRKEIVKIQQHGSNSSVKKERQDSVNKILSFNNSDES